MTVEQIDSTKVLISLCNEDLTEYSLRFDTMSFNDPHSRRILNKLLTIACGKTGMKQEKDKSMLVETMPHSNGCLILLTINHKKKKRTVYKIKRNPSGWCCRFQNAEDFLSCMEALELCGSAMYRVFAYLFGGSYFLFTEQPKIAPASAAVLSEFGRLQKKDCLFNKRLSEGGKLLFFKPKFTGRLW